MTRLMEWTALMATLKVGEKHFYFIPMEKLEYKFPIDRLFQIYKEII